MRISDWSSDVCSSDLAAGVPAWRQAWSEASFWDPRGSARLYHQAGVGLRCEGGVDGFDTLLGYRTATRFRPTVADRTGGSVNIESSTTRRRTRAAAAPATRQAKAGAPPAEPLLQLLAAMQEVNAGDFDAHLPPHWDGIEGKLAAAFNDIVRQNKRMAAELARVGQKVGRQGQTRQRMAPANRQGAWAEMEQSVNQLIDDLVRPVDTITEAMARVAKIGRAPWRERGGED